MPDDSLKSLLNLISGSGGPAGILVAFAWFAYKLLGRFDAMLKERDEALAATVKIIRDSHKEFADRAMGVFDRNTQALSDTSASNRENSQAVSKLSTEVERLRESIERKQSP